MQPVGSNEQREMPRDVVLENPIARPAVPFLARFAGKFVLDIMPAALASVIGGFLFTQYQFGHTVPKPQLEAVTPASAEMLAMVRDEHAVIIDYLKAQTAAEKSKLAAETAADRAADAPNTDASAATGAKPAVKPADLHQALDTSARRTAVALPRPAPARVKVVPVVATATDAAHDPLVIAQADQSSPANASPSNRLASDPNSLLGKTLDFKDHVVDATTHAVTAIGDVITSMGDRIGSIVNGGRQFTSDVDGRLPTACAKLGESCGF